MGRAPGLSVRLKLTLSYAGFVMLAGALLLGAVWVFLLRYIPRGETVIVFGAHVFISPGRGALLRDFAPAAAIALASLLTFGIAGGWLLAGRMLAPLTHITEATRIAATGSLSHRIRLPGRRDEFRELADAFDNMLARLEAHSAEERRFAAEQQRFAANASHELRTPLAVTQTLLDVARKDPNRDNDELVDRLHAVNTRAIDLTEALLLLSRADQRSFTPQHVDLSLIAEEATETLLPLAEKHGVTIETSGCVTPTIGSEALLLQLITNLVHNAIVHNLPEQGSVCVTTSVHPQTVMLTVVNTGEKLTPDMVSTLVEPFLRGTERIRTDHSGVGLGLAIVKSITQAHDGTLTLTPRSAGGLCVTVQLPAKLGTPWQPGEHVPTKASGRCARSAGLTLSNLSRTCTASPDPMDEILLLALLAAANPTLLAATTVMLLSALPERLMVGFWLGAMLMSVTLGLVIVLALEGSSLSTRPRTR